MNADSNSDVLRFLCRHLVSFGWIDWLVDQHGNRVGEPRVHCPSGFIMSFRGAWVLATAGHVIQQLETLINNPAVHIEGECLIDGWSIGAINHDAIPFDLVGASRFYYDSNADGLDFGFILIRPIYQRLLQANGIQAVDEERWRYLHLAKFTHYGVLGIPHERVTRNLQIAASETRVSSIADPLFIPLTWVGDPPDDLPATVCPRFVGRLPEGLPVALIPGMSGGPIFAFGEDDGILNYWIVAIQSSVHNDHRMIFGSLISHVGSLVERDMEEFDRANESDTTQADEIGS